MTAATVSWTRTGRERTVEVTSRFVADYDLVSGDPSSEVEAYSVVQHTQVYTCMDPANVYTA